MLWWPELGFIALLLALCVSLLTALLSLASGSSWARRLPALCPRRGSLAQLALTAAGFALLLLALLTDDFSLRYVAQHSHSALARGLKLAAAWGGHEGSLLLWLLCLAGWSALYALCARRQAAQANAYTLGLMALIVGAFLLFIVTLGDPFARQFPAPAEGRDLNPMLQHPGLIFHPPLLYLGYGGLALCAARLLAGLLARQTAQAMADGCWRWLLPAWGCLSAGIILGSWWAYSELGWGGFWFWDPVENASLLPWLSATALLHSLSVTRRSGALAHWSLLLALTSLIFTLMGTLIVRSGVLLSVHAFALDETRALALLLLFGGLSVGALTLYALSAGRLTPVTAPVSLPLQGILWLFSAAALIVLIGTLYPMLYGLLGWGRISVGAPYFNGVLLPFALLALALMLYGGLRHRVGAGGRLAHLGALLCALGIGLHAAGQQERSVALAPGQSTQLGEYRFTLREVTQFARGNYTAERGEIWVQRGGETVARLYPERRHYLARNQQMFEPGISWSWRDEWYALMAEKQGDRYALRLYLRQGVRWIWCGGGLMIAGALLCLRTRRREP
ncbi:heme lyase CcmF/NrfE family subunit [Edwardsiella piscicida]|uniref:heme lyase CcmF/NrfE family subunit n=1 Tax=Edwardsiella piscicida TaxID=1263550 RepID=UPI000933BB8D|nr:heme lyase CcmF/NrfE family subunit [Edwardsiella piscicida]EKS7768140.1 heme lyase CcmF/NrfE family subunit [Edwardsiella piscicida]EKS7812663.1 heme lyase CcmF/NrfE family subunit [Edwardsiella piscicida]UBU79916.1 heme lyase CcmF/NrfE family subunit [Edwardsiella piscicida]UCQ20499.1 heme lyase CcmF/NrfE family subunit [Edwardsiella piscicida]UCQ30641.1 heme lyase CcmF/NrfE family subunit [Edwardsiella piscicida]